MATGGREIRIYFEGDPALRPGFAKFLQNGLGRSVPIRLIATGGRPVSDFMKALRAHPDAENILLMDADVLLGEIGIALSEIEGADLIKQLINQLKNRDDWDRSRGKGVTDDQLHFMIQLMEAWLVCDPEALESFYGSGFRRNRLPTTANIEIKTNATASANL